MISDGGSNGLANEFGPLALLRWSNPVERFARSLIEMDE
jgi:hypothetical protein